MERGYDYRENRPLARSETAISTGPLNRPDFREILLGLDFKDDEVRHAVRIFADSVDKKSEVVRLVAQPREACR